MGVPDSMRPARILPGRVRIPGRGIWVVARGDIRVPNTRSTDGYIMTEIDNDNVWYETEERKPPENDEERIWTSWENLAHLDL